MTKKLLIVGAVAVVAAAAWATWFVLTHREPVYQGKSLSAWMDQWNKHLLADRKSPDWTKRQEAEAAIRHIGTDALPTLLAMVRARDSLIKNELLVLNRWQKVLKVPFKPAAYYHGRATLGFGALGPIAKPGVPALIELLSDRDQEVRAAAAVCLSQIGPDAKEAVPALIQTLNREGNGWGPVILNSMLALGAIHSDPDTVIPLLLEYVDGPRKEWNYCGYAMDALGRYREKAKSAVPAILPYLNDPDPSRSFSADAALCRIGYPHSAPVPAKAPGH